jgi:hypothetical protein
MQPRPAWQAPPQGLLLYDWYARQAEPLQGTHSFPMAGFSDRLFLLCPIRAGWAVIGRSDKFLAPAAVEILQSTPRELTLRVKEGGPVAVWQADAKAAVQSAECAVRRIAPHLWQADLPPKQRDALVRVRRP